MTETDGATKRIEQVLDTPDLADALESDRFKQFLDHIPFAVIVAELQPSERIVYANLEAERLTRHDRAELEGETWAVLPGQAAAGEARRLADAVVGGEEYIGCFKVGLGDGELPVDAWSNIILGDDGAPAFRLVALAEVDRLGDADLNQRLHDKDTLLRELQHRVKNNLQMITALIRLEARNLPDDATGERFDRLAGRIDALALLYRSLSDEAGGEDVDLGIYLSEIASSVMRAHATEGIRLDLKVDTWRVSVNLAMPTGLVVNELLTNALKHAFAAGRGGTITLHSLVDETGCRVTVADDGIGLGEGVDWPKPGKLGALIVKSLRHNANAEVAVASRPGEGVRVTIFFARPDATPGAA